MTGGKQLLGNTRSIGRRPAQDGFFRPQGLAQRKFHEECGALADHAADFNPSVMVFNNPAGERQPQACSFPFGGVERPEDIGQVLRRNAPSCVGYLR